MKRYLYSSICIMSIIAPLTYLQGMDNATTTHSPQPESDPNILPWATSLAFSVLVNKHDLPDQIKWPLLGKPLSQDNNNAIKDFHKKLQCASYANIINTTCNYSFKNTEKDENKNIQQAPFVAAYIGIGCAKNKIINSFLQPYISAASKFVDTNITQHVPARLQTPCRFVVHNGTWLAGQGAHIYAARNLQDRSSLPAVALAAGGEVASCLAPQSLRSIADELQYATNTNFILSALTNNEHTVENNLMRTGVGFTVGLAGQFIASTRPAKALYSHCMNNAYFRKYQDTISFTYTMLIRPFIVYTIHHCLLRPLLDEKKKIKKPSA